jgi:hypothetical protein
MLRSLCILALIAVAAAGDLVWTGMGNTSVWDDYRNWDQKRIPTSADNVIINLASAQVTLDVSWVTVASLHVSAGLFIQPQAFSVGNLIVDNEGVYRLDSGNAALTIGGTANITSSQGLLFASGYFSGALIVGADSMLNFTGAAAKGFNDAKVVATGSAVCSAGATINFNGSSINFIGGLTVQAGAPVNFMEVSAGGNKITGNLALEPQAGLQLLVGTNFNTISMGSNAVVTVTKERQSVGTLQMDDSSVVNIAGENTGLAAGSIASKGTISTLSPVSVGGRSQLFSLIVDGAAPVVFGSGVAFGSLTIKSGSVQLSGPNTADSAQFGTATVTGVSTLVVSDLRVMGPNMNLANASINVTATANLNGQVQVSSGYIGLQQNAVGSVASFSVLAAGGVAVAGYSFINNGQINIATQMQFTQVNAVGSGTYALGPQSGLGLANSDLTAGQVILGDSAQLTGSVAGANIQQTAAADQKFVDFTVDTFVFHCPSPCPSITSNGRSVNFSAQAASS